MNDAEPKDTLSRYRQNFRNLTAKTSDISRSLGLTAIAVTWLFSGGIANLDTPQGTLAALQSSHLLFAVLCLAVLSLTMDLLQYTAGASLWGLLHWALTQVTRNDTVEVMGWRGRLGWKLLATFGSTDAVATTEASNTVLHQPIPSSPDARRDALRAVLAGRDGYDAPAREEVVAVLLDHVPTWIPGATVALWTLKIALLIATFLCLLVYLVPLPC